MLSAIATSERKSPSRRCGIPSLHHTPLKNVIAAPAANAANQEYASRRGDSLSPV
jgi:hypothetical protein